GHCASQAPVFEQLPKPCWSISAIIALTLSFASGLPWGRRAYCEILADTKSIADAFLQAATQAPQPMHTAASKARSLFFLLTSTALASAAAPVVTAIKPPATWILSK